MATSVQPAENTIHGFTIVTHVVPAGTGHYGQSTEAGASTTGQFGKFLKGDPKALGVVQIMIGIITFMLGIVSAVFFYTASKVIGVMFWGAVLYMVSGGLSVDASKKAHGCVVKGSLVMNVFSAVAAGIAIIVMVVDIAIANPCYRYYYYSRPNEDLCGLWYGIAGIQLVLAVLEFIISICTSAFACKATCCNDPTQVMFVPAHPVTTV
ncbi:membrane-spanning 4-domains subfamily A member 4A-like [Astyanax mexicanus]|uniref:Membrane-spanning 4-domains subfamily A member 4A-like n=1 Tax=Astyanax mexicanus TaxID=7994 RepID=A0A8T2M0C4_ASTMX|nr:membrane-spanning 4-domains subfamily A member 4A-like [Astyanax mexicanus]